MKTKIVVNKKTNKNMYYLNGKLVGEQEYLEAVRLEANGGEKPTTHEQGPGDPKGKTCIFTGEPATRTKYVNGWTIYLSEESFRKYTTGEKYAKLREVLQQEEEEKEKLLTPDERV